MTVKITGKGSDALADGVRRQVIPCIQERHVSDLEAEREAHWVESIMVQPAAEPEELGGWAGL
jgi:hypothetical protein